MGYTACQVRATHKRGIVVNSRNRRALLVFSLLAVSGCATQSPVSHPADVAAITAFNARYLGAINAGDMATLSSLTDDDHIMLIPGRAPLEGKAANDAANARYFEQFNTDEKWNPVETVIDGNLAYQRGTFTSTATPKAGGAARTSKGSFLRIYRRQPDGSWRMTRDMFNSGP
jgi:ketosteroid isomerase-like protein